MAGGDVTKLRGLVRARLSPRTDDMPWWDPLIDVGITRVLENYTMYGPVIEATFAVTVAGAQQLLTEGTGKIANLFEVASLAYPWAEDNAVEFWEKELLYRTIDQDGHHIIAWDRKIITFKADDLIRVRYKQVQTVDEFEGADATTYSLQQEPFIALGAAGFACNTRVLDLAEDPSAAADAAPTLRERSAAYLAEYMGMLTQQAARALSGPRWTQMGLERGISLMVNQRRGAR